jgi:hypothetical protein
MLRATALRGSVLAACGLGALALRQLATPTLHPATTAIGAGGFPALAASASELLRLLGDAAALPLVAELEAIVRLAAEGDSATAQWHISRRSAAVLAEAERRCRERARAAAEGAFRDAVDCQTEVLPQLQTHLDNLLHNHLLGRR